MKYCPFCGADLIEGAVSFCAECGKELPPAKTESKQSETGKKQASKKKNSKKKSKKVPVTPEPEIIEDGYDGYYDAGPHRKDARHRSIRHTHPRLSQVQV